MDPQEPDVVGIGGAGRLGRALARVALHAGRRVVLANSRGPDSLADATNDVDGTDLSGTTSSELVASLVPDARQVGGPFAGANLVRLPAAS